ncbi:hypothetical protein J2J97_31795 (plasmid) [Rhizobium bangladeshense]|uniref:hypothetical protein n=1 Tax=Rhizobium bangladeshense TaxID=1138189 RepID=UPI001A98C505|nr:hypothetical protein [Rhizobium bangladeshense]QSY98655.1 hypothetical protein J2J97_31795 [Rhizobium bangladeshense]
MAIKALKLGSTRKYESVYDEDRGTEHATVWIIGTLDSRTAGRIKDQATRFVVDANAPDEEVATVISTSEVNYQRVQYGLKGFERFQDEDGNDVAYQTVSKRHGGQSYQIVSDSVMQKIPQDIIAELAAEIAKGNELTKADVKNSGKP